MNYSKLIDACICIEDIEAIFKQSVASCDKCNFLLVWIQFAHYINHKTCQPIVTNQILLKFLVSLQQQITYLIIAKTTKEIGYKLSRKMGFLMILSFTS
jgi:phage FluMu protein Com